jgi:molybdopterin molybdotransferase
MGIVDATEVVVRAERVELLGCAGRHLAEDLKCDRDAPPFDKSLMDGYAVRAADLGKLPRELIVVEHIAAGASAVRPLGEGEAMAIMTGAPLPAGADAVVPVEQVEIVRDSNRARFREATGFGRFIARKGNDAAAGSVVLKKGVRIGAAQVAVAASIGVVDVPVFSLPSVAVLGTGDELVLPGDVPAANQIRSCNNPMLMALLERRPCRAVDLGLVRDDPALIAERIEAGLENDVLLITGGMSMGERDYVPGILRRLGAEMKITKLRIKPGKPFVFAKMPGGKFVFGLPGNPVSAFVCTVCFVSRLLERMAGGLPRWEMRAAPLLRSLVVNGTRTFFQPAIFDGRAVMPLHWNGSADVFTLGAANALIVRPENQEALSVGAVVEFMEL